MRFWRIALDVSYFVVQIAMADEKFREIRTKSKKNP